MAKFFYNMKSTLVVNLKDLRLIKKDYIYKKKKVEGTCAFFEKYVRSYKQCGS